MPKKTKKQSKWFETELKPELEKICRMYKACPQEKRKGFIEKFNRIITAETEPNDFVRNAMFSFRDSLIERYG